MDGVLNREYFNLNNIHLIRFWWWWFVILEHTSLKILSSIISDVNEQIIKNLISFVR